MSKENYGWLVKELPSWVEEGIVTPESAKVLLGRYAQEKSAHRPSGMAFSLLGFTLVGLGIISILAYNWDELGHFERTLLAIVLLLGAQGLSFFAKRYRPHDKSLLEGSGILWFLMMGASLAIIGQTYHLGGTMFDFLCVWLLLSFGIAWLLPSSGAAFLQILLWTAVWVLNRNDFTTLVDLNLGSHINPLFLLAIAFIWGCYYVRQLRFARNANATLFLSWGLAISLLFVFMVEIVIETNELRNLRTTFNFLALFFAIYYLAGKLYLSHGDRSYQRPFERIGKLGVFVLLLSHVSLKSWSWMGGSVSYLNKADYTSWLMISLTVLFLALFIVVLRKQKRVPAEVLVMLTPFIFFVYSALQNQPRSFHYEAMVFINVSLLLGATLMIICGSKEAKIGLINQGMILIALTVWIHFMDANFDLVAKGVAFIVTGVVFLGMNALVRRRLGAKA